jgi:hypothetical protein
MSLWFIIGSGLMLWAIWDLVSGTTFLHRRYTRRFEPKMFWLTWSAWAVIAVAVTYGSLTL